MVMRSGKDEGGVQGVKSEADAKEVADFCQEALREGRAGRKLRNPQPALWQHLSSGILLGSLPSSHWDCIFYSTFLSLSTTLQFDNNRSLMEYIQLFKRRNYKGAIFQS